MSEKEGACEQSKQQQRRRNRGSKLQLAHPGMQHTHGDIFFFSGPVTMESAKETSLRFRRFWMMKILTASLCRIIMPIQGIR